MYSVKSRLSTPRMLRYAFDRLSPSMRRAEIEAAVRELALAVVGRGQAVNVVTAHPETGNIQLTCALAAGVSTASAPVKTRTVFTTSNRFGYVRRPETGPHF
jgi:hypothetical protein